MENCLVIFRGTTEMYRFPFGRIVYIEAITNENWCRIYMAEPLKEHVNPMEIPLLLSEIWKEIQVQIDSNNGIYPCGRSTLINPAYIRKIDVSDKTIILSDGINHFELKPSREACIDIKAHMNKAFTF